MNAVQQGGAADRRKSRLPLTFVLYTLEERNMYKKPNLKILNLKKRERRNIDLFLDIVPESKKAMGKNQVEIQKMITKQMKERNFQKIRSKIAMEVTVYSTAKTPPRIERFTKNLLDIMHKKEILEDATDADFLPFEEDRDIKYLSVRYIFLPGKSHTVIRIRPFSSFISNLHFIFAEINDDESDKDDFLSIKNHYEDLIKNKIKYAKAFTKEAYESMIDLAMLDVQKSLTSNMAITSFILRLIYPKKGTKPAFVKDTYKEWADMLMAFPIRIRLPEIPTLENTSKAYKAEIAKQLSSYLEKNPIFKNLKAPTIATVFYSPPLGKKRFFKDVDNIMLEYVLPTFNDTFIPPLSLLSLHMRKNDKYSQAVPKSLNGSAMGYVIIELPKKYSENQKGFLSVGFEVIDLDKQGLIQSVDKRIESYMQLNQYVD